MRRAAILGLGQRGLLWAQTCQMAGWEVQGFDPNDRIGRFGSNRNGWCRVETISAAVHQADWVFCCVPERLELVQMVVQRAQAAAPERAIVAIVSALELEALQGCAVRPWQIVRLSEGDVGGMAIDVSSRNPDLLRARVAVDAAELMAVRGLEISLPVTQFDEGVESA